MPDRTVAQERNVEALAVEGDEQLGSGQVRGQMMQESGLLGVIAGEELPDQEVLAGPAHGAGEKHARISQAAGLQVEEEQTIDPGPQSVLELAVQHIGREV